jgi:hypothetical protein
MRFSKLPEREYIGQHFAVTSSFVGAYKMMYFQPYLHSWLGTCTLHCAYIVLIMQVLYGIFSFVC